MQVQNFRGFSGFRGLNVGFRVLLGDQFSGSGSGWGFKSRGRPPRVSGFRVLDYITKIDINFFFVKTNYAYLGNEND